MSQEIEEITLGAEEARTDTSRGKMSSSQMRVLEETPEEVMVGEAMRQRGLSPMAIGSHEVTARR